MKVYTFKVTIAMTDDNDFTDSDVRGAIKYQDDTVIIEAERIDTYVTKVED